MFWSVSRAPYDDFWYEPVGPPTLSGQRVTADTSLALPAVYSAVRVITEALMQIPLMLYQRSEDGGKERAVDHSLYKLLHDQPNEHQTSAEWREIMQHHLLMRGNAYSQLFSDGVRITELGMPIHPDLVKPRRVKLANSSIAYVYDVRQENGTEIEIPGDSLLHLRGLGVGSDGVTGMSTIEMQREAIGAGLAAQQFTSTFYRNNARPGGWIEHPTNFKDDEQKKRFVKSFQKAQTGVNQHSVAVLEYGLKYHPLDLKLVDAQFLETRKYSNLDVARMFRVPPHLIMELDRATFSNIEQQDIEFVKFTMLPWLVRWEKRLSLSLLNDDERDQYFFEFLVDGLERGDSDARSRYYKAGIQDGWLTRNEVRRRENLNPKPGLDQPLQPMNMQNPGGDNDERLNAFKASAAKVCARKQRYQLAENPGAETIQNQWKLVRDFMQCSDAKAMKCCNYVASLFQDDLDMSPDEWEARQVRLLMEMT